LSSKIALTFINKQTGQVFGEASNDTRPGDPVSSLVAKATQPLSSGRGSQDVAPVPTNLSYNTDMQSFTDAFSFTTELAIDERFNIGSHDFVEFFFRMTNPAPGFIEKHQIGVGFIEKFHKETSPDSTKIDSNGRDLFGQFMFVPFKKPIPGLQTTLRDFINSQVIRASYLERYLDLRGDGISKLNNLGLFSGQMLFRSDLEAKKAQTLQSYAELAINRIYMNRLGQVEALGRPDNVGSTAAGQPSSSLGELRKGDNVDQMIVMQDYTNVYSEYTVFWVSGQAEQERNHIPGQTFKNDDPRVAHIDRPGFRTFSMGELANLAGSVSGQTRIEDVARSIMRQANQNLNSVIVTQSDPFFTTSDGLQIPYMIGQKWTLKSNEPEFTSPQQPNGTDQVDLIIGGINYNQSPDNQQVQIRFVEEGTIV
jgi:hypothetical protein